MRQSYKQGKVLEVVLYLHVYINAYAYVYVPVYVYNNLGVFCLDIS